MRAPMTQTCPRCNAQPDEYCRSKSGYTATTHAARTALVAGWSDDEKLAAVGAMRRDRAERRAATVAYMERAKTDPDVLAQRAWWTAQFDRIDREQRADEGRRRVECLDQWLHADDCMCADPNWVRPAPPLLDIGRRVVTDLAQVRASRGGAA